MAYPLQAYRFKVECDKFSVQFSEVGGLTQEVQVIEYRDGMTSKESPLKMPGLRKVNNISLKRGITIGNNEFFNWLNTVNLNTIDRRDLIISLLDQDDAPRMIWNVRNAFPIKVEGPSLKATDNNAAIESIELAHEGLTVSVA